MDLIQLPFINAPTAQGQMEQLKSYLYQLSEQLNIQISSMESSEGLTQMVREVNTSGSAKSEKALSVFNAVKAMIIKSADIVNAYYEKIDLHLKGEYVAQSGFGDYMQNTELTIEGNSTSVSQIYKNTQTLTYVDSLETHNTDAYIKTGLLYEDTQGNPVYGMEIGQKNVVDGVTTYDKSARFTSGRLSFYDANGDEVAYISGDKLSIVRGEISGDSVKSGSIKSQNYAYTSGNFSSAGAIFDLSDGMIRTKNLYTKGDALKLKGEINTESSVKQTYLPSQYSSSDIVRINAIIAGSTPTTSDYNKYALWHDYSIDSDCRDCIQHLINGTSTKLEFLYTANLGDRWSGGNGVEVRATVRETRANGSVTNSSRDIFTSGADGTYVKNLYADGIYTGGNDFLPLRYIKAQGTSNGWTYRKWSDGVLEQWRNTTETFISSSWQPWGSLYQTYPGVSYFFGVAFTSIPTLNIQCITNTWGFPMVNDLGGTSFKLFAVRPNAPGVTATISFSMYAIGTWI